MQDPTLLQRPLTWQYSGAACTALQNTGFGWKVAVDGQASYLRGGPLANSYQLAQFHCHWGKCYSSGSEHTVNGSGFAAELHLVHWNVDLYNSADEATCSPSGLAVLGIFFQVGNHNDELAKVTDVLNEIPQKGEECQLSTNINLAAFIPESRDYWTYEGSLTTPPCYESVTWIVFKSPLQVSEEQIEKFRSLFSCTNKVSDIDNIASFKVEANCRPTQPLNNRLIREAPY